jgi:hypothetical protein
MKCSIQRGLRLSGVVLLAISFLPSCSPSNISKTVDQSKLKDMSRQGQLWIYDAENEIVVALDKLDEAIDAQRKIKQRMEVAERSLEAAEKRKHRGGVDLAEQWIKYLEGMQAWARAQVEAQRVGVIAARAGVELAKAQVINREDLLGGKDFSVKDYQEQYDTWKKKFEEERQQVSKKWKIARTLEQKWWTLRQRFIAETGDYDSGLWIE